MIGLILTVAVIIISYLLLKLTTNFDYWKKRRVCYLTPLPIFGNFSKVALFKSSIGGVTTHIYRSYPEEPYAGAFMGSSPVLVVRDPNILKLILSKDFYYFHGRGLGMIDTEREPLDKNLFGLEGDLWKVLRQNLTPLFSSAKMKNMFYLMEQCTKNFECYIKNRMIVSDEFEVRDLTSRLSMDVIGSCAFGLNMNAMEEQDSEFRKVGYKIFEPSKGKTLKNLIRFISPTLYDMLRLSESDPGVTNFFVDLSKKMIEMRSNMAGRHDFVDLLVELKRKGYVYGDSIENMKPGMEKKKIQLQLDDKLLAAQSFVFFAAGFETSSTTVSYSLRELALNQNIQEKLHCEIDRLLEKYKGIITYEMVQEAKYLEKVIDETGRKYPIAMNLTRECNSNYKLPDGLVIDKGVKIIIPIHGIHHDPKYYPDPEVFDPERFDPDVANQRPTFTYMPFGEGQRLCIGMRFGKLQVSVSLITILRHYKVERTARTEDVIQYDPTSSITAPKNGIWLKLVPRHV